MEGGRNVGIGVSMRVSRRMVLSIVGLLLSQALVLAGPVAGAESSVERLAGGNRYATAVAVSRAQYPDGAILAFVATGADHADAIAISAAVDGAGPVLLAERDRLPDETAAELARLEPFAILVIGGPAAISEETFLAIARRSGHETRRIAGSNRFATAAEISRVAFDSGADVAFVVNGGDFRDGLSATPAAAAFDGPLLLTSADVLPEATEAELERLAPGRIVVVGDPTDVSDGVVAALRELAPQVTRIGSEDDEATSAAVSRATFSTSPTAFVATAADFADGLTGGAFAGVLPAPMLLVQRDEVSDAVKCELTRLGASEIVVLGGPSAVSDRVVAELEAGYQAEDIAGCDAGA